MSLGNNSRSCCPTTNVSTSKPTAVLRCAMAESFAAWVRDEASSHVAALGDALRSVDTYGSYECRGRNWVADAKLANTAYAIVIAGDLSVIGKVQRAEHSPNALASINSADRQR